MNEYKVIGVILWIALIGIGGSVVYLTHVGIDAGHKADIEQMKYNDIASELNYMAQHDVFVKEIGEKCRNTRNTDHCEKTILDNTFDAYIYAQYVGEENYNPYISTNGDTETTPTRNTTSLKAASYLVFVILFCAGMMMYSAMDFMTKL